uniref:Uncharacterized protein n=1 Tax=Meloidogyne enterolobii TaxID=390850 RepID=A0A6V7VCD2_MELEN|nr:unnamed protein product [Meloidogyne enterolobii]
MKHKNFLIYSTIIFSFYEFFSVKCVGHNRSLDKEKGVSTSYDEQACQLSEQLTESVELTGLPRTLVW